MDTLKTQQISMNFQEKITDLLQLQMEINQIFKNLIIQLNLQSEKLKLNDMVDQEQYIDTTYDWLVQTIKMAKKQVIEIQEIHQKNKETMEKIMDGRNSCLKLQEQNKKRYCKINIVNINPDEIENLNDTSENSVQSNQEIQNQSHEQWSLQYNNNYQLLQQQVSNNQLKKTQEISQILKQSDYEFMLDVIYYLLANQGCYEMTMQSPQDEKKQIVQSIRKLLYDRVADRFEKIRLEIRCPKCDK